MNRDFDVTDSEREILGIFAYQGGETYASEIAERLDKSRQTIGKQLKNLREKDLIQLKVESSVKIYEVTRDGILFLMWSDLSNIDIPKVRHHKIFIKFKLVEGYSCLDSEEKDATSTKLKNWVKFQDTIEDHGINTEEEISYFVTPRHLIVQIPEILASCTCQGIGVSTIEALHQARCIKKDLEKRHEELKIGRGYPIFSDHHYALEKHPMAYALDMLDLDDYLNSQSQCEVVLDHSKGYPELEAEGLKSEESIQQLLENVNYQVKESIPQKFQELSGRISKLEE